MPAPETPKDSQTCKCGSSWMLCTCYDSDRPAPAVGVPDHEVIRFAVERASKREAQGRVVPREDIRLLLSGCRALLSRSGETAPSPSLAKFIADAEAALKTVLPVREEFLRSVIAEARFYLTVTHVRNAGASAALGSGEAKTLVMCGRCLKVVGTHPLAEGEGVHTCNPRNPQYVEAGSGETREPSKAVWVALRELAPHYSPKTQAKLGALADACEGVGPMWPEEGSAPTPDVMRAAVRYLDDCLTLGSDERRIAMLLVHAGEQAILAGYALPAPRERHGRVSVTDEMVEAGVEGWWSHVKDSPIMVRSDSPAHTSEECERRRANLRPIVRRVLTAALGAETP